MKIISGILVLITVFLSFKHGWDGLNLYLKPAGNNLFTDLGFGRTAILILSLLTLVIGVLVLFPQTFFAGNLLNAASILLIMALSLKTGNLKTAFIEIPFLLMPLILIWLGHPLKK